MKPSKIAAAMFITLFIASHAMAQNAKPNIVVIYTDDQGYGDVSALNPDAKFQTPNLDRLAKEGIAFTHGHSADSVCTPSRYALLTGRYPWRTHLKRGVFGSERKCLIEDGRMTLASLLKENGYHTGMVGKWHLGMDFPNTRADRDWTQPVQDMPLDKGFDYYFGIPASLNYGVLAWFEGRFAKVPPTLYTKKKPNRRHVDYRIKPPYKPEMMGDKKDKGLEVAPDFIDNECLTRFTDKAIEWMQGKSDDAKNGKPFFLYLPYTSPHYPVCPLPEFHGQGDAGAYGEFVIETDHHVGRIMKFLKDSDLDENTLVLFTSDNGPEKSWSKRIEDFQHDSRGGYRQGKRSVYEGGHRVPFIIRWPAGIKQPGRRWEKPVGQVDLLATVAELLGAECPDDAGEDSQSFASILGNPDTDHQRLPLITHGNGGSSHRYAITNGDWKLVLRDDKSRDELYNLATDRAEKTNLAAEHPETVRKLTHEISQIIASGRTTPGEPQPNDTGYWKDLRWMTEDTYNEAAAKGSFLGQKSDFKGFDRCVVETAKGNISVVCPKKAAPGKPWMWRSMFWGGDSNAVKRITNSDLKLIDKGYHVVIAPGDVSGHPSGNARIDAAYATLTEQHGFSKRLSMASMSRETLALFRWASANPEKVESIYVDNGVCNVNSWPAGKLVSGSDSKGAGAARSWTLFKKSYGFATDAEALASKESPIDLLEPLAKAGVPILMGCGTQDDTVPHEENAFIMKQRYEALGGSIQIVTEEKGHHPHGLKDMTPVVDFITEHTTSIQSKRKVRQN